MLRAALGGTLKFARNTWPAMWALLGVLGSSATLVALTKRGFSLPLHGTPELIFQTYEWVRNNVFDGLYLLVANWWRIALSDWAKDAIAGYLFLGFSLNRAMVFVYGKAQSYAEEFFTFAIILLFWPIVFLGRFVWPIFPLAFPLFIAVAVASTLEQWLPLVNAWVIGATVVVLPLLTFVGLHFRRRRR